MPEGGDAGQEFDDGFAEQGVGDDVIPTFDIETLQQLSDDDARGDDASSSSGPAPPGGWAAVRATSKAERERQAMARTTLRAGARVVHSL